MARVFTLDCLFQDVLETMRKRNGAYAAWFKDASMVYDFDNKELRLNFPQSQVVSYTFVQSERGMEVLADSVIETLLDSYIIDNMLDPDPTDQFLSLVVVEPSE